MGSARHGGLFDALYALVSLLKSGEWETYRFFFVGAMFLVEGRNGALSLLHICHDSFVINSLTFGVLQIFNLWHPSTHLQQAPQSVHRFLYNVLRGHSLAQQRIYHHRYVSFLLTGPLRKALDCLLTLPGYRGGSL